MGNFRDLERNCDYCGKKYRARSTDVNNGKGLCCTISCGVRKKNLEKTLSTSVKSAYRRARKIYIKRHGTPACRICKKVPADVHHKDGNISNNADENHDPLCRNCHVALENHLFPKRWKRSSMKAEATVADTGCDSPSPPPNKSYGGA
jgi:hypothetical protein